MGWDRHCVPVGIKLQETQPNFDTRQQPKSQNARRIRNSTCAAVLNSLLSFARTRFRYSYKVRDRARPGRAPGVRVPEQMRHRWIHEVSKVVVVNAQSLHIPRGAFRMRCVLREVYPSCGSSRSSTLSLGTGRVTQSTEPPPQRSRPRNATTKKHASHSCLADRFDRCRQTTFLLALVLQGYRPLCGPSL